MEEATFDLRLRREGGDGEVAVPGRAQQMHRPLVRKELNGL